MIELIKDAMKFLSTKAIEAILIFICALIIPLAALYYSFEGELKIQPITVGQTYNHCCFCDDKDPFEEKDEGITMRVIDIKENYVQYQYLNLLGNLDTNSLEKELFLLCNTLINE